VAQGEGLMLEAAPDSFWSWNFTVRRAGLVVARLSLAAFSERGELDIDGAGYQVARAGWASGAWSMSTDGVPLVSAEKPSAFHRRFEVTVGDQAYTLQARSALGRAFELWAGDRVLGTFEPHGWLSRKLLVDLPDTFSLAVQVFMTWLVIVLWRRAAQS